MTDHTAEIFAALGVRPETQPWAYTRNPYFQRHEPTSLLSNSLEADGLAVRLVEIMADQKKKTAYQGRKNGLWEVTFYGYIPQIPVASFAHAVHDALVDALGIGKEK